MGGWTGGLSATHGMHRTIPKILGGPQAISRPSDAPQTMISTVRMPVAPHGGYPACILGAGCTVRRRPDAPPGGTSTTLSSHPLPPAPPLSLDWATSPGPFSSSSPPPLLSHPHQPWSGSQFASVPAANYDAKSRTTTLAWPWGTPNFSFFGFYRRPNEHMCCCAAAAAAICCCLRTAFPSPPPCYGEIDLPKPPRRAEVLRITDASGLAWLRSIIEPVLRTP